jgi:hypothetical protein
MTDQLDFDFAEDVRTNFSECPASGIYRDRDFKEWYAPIRAINSGIVTWGMVSMRHMHAAFEGRLGSEDTLSRKFGRAVHSRLLEPETFAERVLVSQPCCARLKSGDRKGATCGKAASFVLDSWTPAEPNTAAWFCGTHKPDAAFTPDEFVTPAELERIEAMAEALHGHPAMALLKAAGWSECSVVFEHNSLMCKGRLDRYSKEARFVCDVKKCRVGHGTMEECRKSIENYGYLRQAAIYWKAIEVLEGFRPRFLWLFIEDNEPFDVQLVEPEEWELEHAWQSVAGVLSGFRNCAEADKWDGYVKSDKDGKIISSHTGAYSVWMASKIRGGQV